MSSNNAMSISLYPHFFETEKRELACMHNCSLSTFRYTSGVEALQITMGRGVITWLPFLGGEIWDWSVDGVSQKFSGFVQEPSYGKDFFHNYGAFLIHCGVLSMGNPTKEDNHPHHGELHSCQPRACSLAYDPDEADYPLSLTCTFTYHTPFEASYTFTPTIRVKHDGTSMIVDSVLKNTAQTPLHYQYLAHINFAYPRSGRLAYSISPFTTETVQILQEDFLQNGHELEEILNVHERDIYDPELVAIMDHDRTAPSTYADGRYVLNTLTVDSGSVSWVLSDTHPLDHTVAWLTRTADRSACGFSLPATGGPTGRVNETRMGTIKNLAPQQEIRLWYAFGSKSMNHAIEASNAISVRDRSSAK